jgi:hypothetical protein
LYFVSLIRTRSIFAISLLAWVLSQGGHILPIPGIKRRRYVEGTSEPNVTLTPAHPAIGLRRYRSAACRAANRTEGSQPPIEDSSTPCRGALSRSAGLSLAAATGISETATVTNLLVNGSAQKLITRREVQRLRQREQRREADADQRAASFAVLINQSSRCSA